MEGSDKLVGAVICILKSLKVNINIKYKSLTWISTLAVKPSYAALNTLARILETNRLTDNNFKDWLRNLKIILTLEKLSHVLDQDPIVLPNRPTTEQRAAFEKWMDEDNRVKCYVLASMSNKLQS